MSARTAGWAALVGFGLVYIVISATSTRPAPEAWTGWHLVFAAAALLGPVAVGLRTEGWLARRPRLRSVTVAVLAIVGADALGAWSVRLWPPVMWECFAGRCATNDPRSFIPLAIAALAVISGFALRRATRQASAMWPYFWFAVAAVSYGASVLVAWLTNPHAAETHLDVGVVIGLGLGGAGILAVIFLPLYWPDSGPRTVPQRPSRGSVPSPTSADIADAEAHDRVGLARITAQRTIGSQLIGDNLTQPKLELQMALQLLAGPPFSATADKWVRRQDLAAWAPGSVHEVVVLADGAVAFVGGRLTPEQRASITVP